MTTQTEEECLQKELLELIVKAGRRCAYDLDHAAGMIHGDPYWRNKLGERAKYWLTIFDPADGPKDYQSRLMNRAEMAEYRLEKALALLDKHKIDHDIVMPF